MNLMGRLERARLIMRRNGVGGLGRTLIAYAKPRRICIFRLDLPASPKLDRSVAGVDIRTGSLEELEQWRVDQPDLVTSFFSDRLSGWKHFCWAWTEGQPVGIAWSTTDSPLMRLAPTEAHIVDVYTAQAGRGKGIGKALMLAACDQLADLGFETAYGSVEPWNTPSWRMVEGVGLFEVGAVTSSALWRYRPSTARWKHRRKANKTS